MSKREDVTDGEGLLSPSPLRAEFNWGKMIIVIGIGIGHGCRLCDALTATLENYRVQETRRNLINLLIISRESNINWKNAASTFHVPCASVVREVWDATSLSSFDCFVLLREIEIEMHFIVESSNHLRATQRTVCCLCVHEREIMRNFLASIAHFHSHIVPCTKLPHWYFFPYSVWIVCVCSRWMRPMHDNGTE